MTDTNDGTEEIVDGDVTWVFDRTFLASNWTCIWGRGCKGILDVPAEELNQGCCSIGAELADDEHFTMRRISGRKVRGIGKVDVVRLDPARRKRDRPVSSSS